MAILPLQTTGLSFRDMEEAAGWTTKHIIVVGVVSIVAFLALLASLVFNLRGRKKVKDMAASLGNAVAELGLQKNRAVSLERELGRRDAFIDRNVLEGPDAYSSASPAAWPNESGRPKGSTSARPDEARAGLFVVGNDDESDGDSGDDSDDSDAGSGSTWWVETLPGGSPDSPLSPTPVPAVRVRRSQIKTIDVYRQDCENQASDLGRAAFQPSKSIQPDQILQNEESQIDRYWGAQRSRVVPEKRA
jgi:hypothetical protein